MHISTHIIGSPRYQFNHTVVKYPPKLQNSIMYFTFIPFLSIFHQWMNKAYKKIHGPENKVIIHIKHYPIASYVAEYHQTDTPGHSINKTNWKKHLYQIYAELQNAKYAADCSTSYCLLNFAQSTKNHLAKLSHAINYKIIWKCHKLLNLNIS